MIRMPDVSFMTTVIDHGDTTGKTICPFDSRCARCRGNLYAEMRASHGTATIATTSLLDHPDRPLFVHPMIMLCGLCGELLTSAITAGEGRFDTLSENQRLSLPGGMAQSLLDSQAKIRSAIEKPTT